LDCDAFIVSVFKALLNRKPDLDGLESYRQHLKNGESHDFVLRSILASDEYKEKSQNFGSKKTIKNPLDLIELSDNGKLMVQQLTACQQLSQDHYQQVWHDIFETDKELVVGQAEYCNQHKDRFWELFNGIDLLLKRRVSSTTVATHGNGKLLEIGVSEFSGFYQHLWPELEVHTLDRPYEEGYIGFTESVAQKISACSAHFSVDLNDPASLAEKTRPKAMAQYDVIVFAEVLEHLTVNPVELLTALIALLKPGGYIYLTTPNFFRWRNLDKISQWENPQEVYPAADDNWDAHYHHREYGLKELLEFSEQSGGVCQAWYFSDCWDRGNDVPDSLPEWQRSNLVTVIARPTETEAKKYTKNIFPKEIASRSDGMMVSPAGVPRPVMMNVETVNTCTLNCVFCAYGSMQRAKETMSLELFEKAISDYSELGGGQLSLTPVVGEIFTDRFLDERLELIQKYENISGVSITTNAVGLRRFKEEKLDRVLQRLNRVHVSIYGVDAEEHQLITQKDTFELFLEGFKRLSEFVGDPEKLWVNFRLFKHREPEELEQWLKQAIGFVPTYFSTIEYAKWSGHEEAPIALPLDAKWNAKPKAESFCVIPAVSAQVHTNGNVSICHCDDYECEPDLSLGNIADSSLSELFDSEKYRNFWGLRGDNMPNFCKGCGFFTAIGDGNKFEEAVAEPLSFIGG